jgi:hypothetical protein
LGESRCEYVTIFRPGKQRLSRTIKSSTMIDAGISTHSRVDCIRKVKRANSRIRQIKQRVPGQINQAAAYSVTNVILCATAWQVLRKWSNNLFNAQFVKDHSNFCQ